MADPSAPLHRSAAILSVGDELVLGQTLDTNSRWLSARLHAAGVRVREHRTVPDDLGQLTLVMRSLAHGPERVDLLVVTGGLGPTADDLTRPALAALLQSPLVLDEGAEADLRRWFTGRSMPDGNLAQAMRPAAAECLPNPHGTAPGLWASVDAGADVACLPGPPREMHPMFEDHLLPRLRRDPGTVIRTRVIPTFGLGESEVAARLGTLMDRSRSASGLPMVGTTASQGVVTIRVRAEGAPDPASALADAAARESVERVGPEWVLADHEATLAECVVGLLRVASRSLVVVESCTGGLLGGLIADVPGASDVFLGGWITYSNGLKQRQVGVPERVLAEHGAVSRECAAAMAEGGLAAAGADHALAITGIAGPSGGTAGKPVGTVWIALASRGSPTDVRRFSLRGDRSNIRTWSAQAALGMLRLRLIGREGLALLRQVEPDG